MALETEIGIGARADFDDVATAIETLVRDTIAEFKQMGVETAKAVTGPEAIKKSINEVARAATTGKTQVMSWGQALAEAKGQALGTHQAQVRLAESYRAMAVVRGQALTQMVQEASAARGLRGQLADLATQARAAARSAVGGIVGPGGVGGFLRNAASTAVGFGGVQLATQIGSAIPANLQKWSAAAIEAQDADARLRVSLQLTGQASERSIDILKRQAAELERVTGVEDEQILTVQTLGLTIGQRTVPEVVRMTKAAADLAAALGSDLESAMMMLIKGGQGAEEQLRRAGIQFKGTGDAVADLDRLLSLVETRLGGVAQRGVSPVTRALREMNAQIHQNDEALGDGLITWATFWKSIQLGASNTVVALRNFQHEQALATAMSREMGHSSAAAGVVAGRHSAAREADRQARLNAQPSWNLSILNPNFGAQTPEEVLRAQLKGGKAPFDYSSLQRQATPDSVALNESQQAFLDEFARLMESIGFSRGNATSADQLPTSIRQRFLGEQGLERQKFQDGVPRFDTSGQEDSPFQAARKEMEALGLTVKEVGDEAGPASKALQRMIRDEEKRQKVLQKTAQLQENVNAIIKANIDQILFEHKNLWTGIKDVALSTFREIISEMVESASKSIGKSIFGGLIKAAIGFATGGPAGAAAAVGGSFLDSGTGGEGDGGGVNMASLRRGIGAEPFGRQGLEPSSRPRLDYVAQQSSAPIQVTIIAAGGGRSAGGDNDLAMQLATRYGTGSRIYDPDLEDFMERSVMPILTKKVLQLQGRGGA